MPARRTRTGSQSSSSDAAAASRTDSKRATGSSTPRLRSARRSKAAVKRAADDTQSADARAGAGQASAPLLAPTSSLAKENAPRQTVKRSSLTVAPRNSSSGSEVTVAHITIGSVAVFFILFFLLVHDPALPLVASLAKLDVLGVATALQLASFGDRVGGAIGLYIAAFACAVEDAAADREFARAVAVGGANATCAVRGQLMWQRPWTHPHAPSADQAAALARVVPFAHQILFVRAGMSHAPRAPVYTTLATDAAGRFATLLPAGARFAVVTREKGEARAHALLRAGTNDEARRREWMRTPAVVIDTRACGDGGRAVVTGAPWPQGASVAVPPEAGVEPSAESGPESRPDNAEAGLDHGEGSGMVFVADQRDPTLPQTHTRDFTIGR